MITTLLYSSIAKVTGQLIALTLGLALIRGGLLAPSRGLGLSGVRILLQLTSILHPATRSLQNAGHSADKFVDSLAPGLSLETRRISLPDTRSSKHSA